MIIPNKEAIATEIRRIMAEKRVKVRDLANAVEKSPTTVTQARNGSASYSVMKKVIDTLDNWEETK